MEEEKLRKEIRTLLKNPDEKSLQLIEKAFSFAKNAHAGQKRNSGEPYFNHLFETAKILGELDMSPITIACGFLHDVIEDTKISAEDIENEFGKEARFLVEGVTKLGHLKYRGTDRYNEDLRRLFIASAKDIRVLIIKLSDRLHNMRTLEFVPKEKQLRIAKETLEIYAPLAYRLGIRKLNRELEDLAFSFVYPDEYKKTLKFIKSKRDKQEKSLEKFLKSLKKEMAKNGIRDFKTDYRVKGIYSLYKKIKRKDNELDKVYDILAIRIIVKEISECYKILGIIHSVWRPLQGRIKDFINFPKANGYKSLHTTVFTSDGEFVEIQIKTEDMQKEAEYGIASHMSYKMTNKEGISLVKKMISYQESENNIGKYMENVKIDFFGERIFVFTPIGDCIDLPVGASVLDFAYNIHSDIGNHACGAKINGKFVKIDTLLSNGDVVQIETKNNIRPTRKWLDYVKTANAKKSIKSALEDKI